LFNVFAFQECNGVLLVIKPKHIRDRLLIFLFAVPSMIVSFFLPREKKRVVFSAFLTKKFNSNSKYLFLWFIQNLKQYDSYFVINDKKLRDHLNASIGNYFIETHSIKGKLFVLASPLWFVSTLEMPVGGFFLNYRRTVIHLGHGTPLKNIGYSENNIGFIKTLYYNIMQTNISFSVASSPYFQPIIAKFLRFPIEKIFIAGQARNDQLFVTSDFDIKTLVKDGSAKNILYAPTWRPASKLKMFPFDDLSLSELEQFLVENKINIFLRTHPNLEEAIDPELFKLSNIYLFSGKQYHEIMDYLNEFDALITDYSSIYFDYLLLDRPIIFLPYDYSEYMEVIGMTVPFDEFAPGYKSYTMKEFFQHLLLSLGDNDMYKNERERVNSLVNTYQKENCKNFVDILREKGLIHD
jgi:CDP-glycerol glycerophosphotransferase